MVTYHKKYISLYHFFTLFQSTTGSCLDILLRYPDQEIAAFQNDEKIMKGSYL